MTREEAIDVLKRNYPDACFSDLREAVDVAIQFLSAQEREKRKWNVYYHGGTDFSYSCPMCGHSAPFDMKGGKVFQKKWNYCPNCGERLDV